MRLRKGSFLFCDYLKQLGRVSASLNQKLIRFEAQSRVVYFHPLNFIRFVLAVGVILFHFGVNYYPFNLPVLKTLIQNSSFRVSFFFFISGFVMSMVYAKQVPGLTAAYFYKRRFTRIFPVYWLAFILTILGLVFLNHAAPRGLNIIIHFLGLQSLYPGNALDLNFTTWSISVELVFYLVFPFLLKWMIQLSSKKLLMVTLIIWLIQSLQHILFIEFLYDGTKAVEEFINAFPLWHLPTFFAGMATARFIALNSFSEFFTKNAFSFFITGLLIFSYIIFIPNPILKYIHNGLLSPLFLIVVASLYYDTSIVNRILSHKHLSRLGDLSYGLFIFQYPVWIICTKLSGENFIRTSWFFSLYFACLLIVSITINMIFEKPLLRILRKEG
jgi:peptidoglycan/LPS O-acetylase OafA/YrhL